jgi:hypothetical protein
MNLSFSTANGNTLTEGFRLTNLSNLLVGTTTDAGFRLDVNGSTRFNGLSTIQGTTASDSGQLGAELLTTGTGDASWTGTSFATGYTHVAGSTTTLTSTLAGVVNTFYQITYTVTGRTAGSFTIAFGGFTSAALTSTGAVGPRATTTDSVVITPTSDFNGTIVLSIRVISISSASVTFNNSAGTVTNQIRISSNNSNTIIGNGAGSRNTTGSGLAIYGRNAGQNNTTGFANSFFGEASGSNNTIGIQNSFFGNSAGVLNTTGSNNSFFGVNSGLANTTGSLNAFFGTSAGAANTTASQNSFFGFSAGAANTTGSPNSAFGYFSLLSNTTGFNNVAIGNRALQVNSTANNNTAVGERALQLNNTGGENTAVGGASLLNNTTGINNVALGSQAGRYITALAANTISNNSIFIGWNSKALADNQTNQIVIGSDGVGLGSNTTVLGNTSTTFGRWYGSLLLGTTTNAASSILTMESTTQGFLPPRMTTTQRNAIASPATGLMIYNSTDNLVQAYNGTSWINL